jgi:hypothetical protein
MLVSALTRIADFTKDDALQLALLEYEIEEAPGDTKKRFSLAYLHSQNGNGDMALYHYRRIPNAQRDSVTWNNLCVCYGEIGASVKSVKAFKKSVDGGETLAMCNLGSKLLNGGFFEEARELCENALARETYNKNVPILLNRLQSVDEDEEKKLNKALERVKTKAAFYRELGKSAVAETPRVIAKSWAAREGTLAAELSNDELKLIAHYNMPANQLAGVLAGGIFSPTAYKYKIEFSGHLRGRMFSGSVVRAREGGAAGLFDGLPSKTFMYLSEDGVVLNVMEDISSQQPTFYEIPAIAAEKARVVG